MSRIHAECSEFACENDYVLVRYAQGAWQARDAELILYLGVPGKPPLVGVGLTERAVRCLRSVERETDDLTASVSRAAAIMNVAAGRDDIPCCAFVPAGVAPRLHADLRLPEAQPHPAAPRALVDFKGGLLPTHDADSSQMILIVKTMREIAATARLRRFFRIYLVPLRADGVDTFGLVSAFFDDYDEPLVIRTPLFDDELAPDFLHLLSSDFFDIYFLDEHNRQLIGFRAENPDVARFRRFVSTIQLVPSTLEFARQFHDDMAQWFGARSADDDDASLRINLREMLPPDNLIEQGQNSPGDLNERDIEIGLHRALSQEDVHRNPARASDRREFVDVLAATDETLLLIQAKDSPVTDASLDRAIDRKMATAEKHVRRAAAQLKGSINHLRSGRSVDIITDGRLWELSMSGREVFGLVIVKELFDPERSACSRLVLSVYEETDVPCLLLDYAEFQELTYFRRTEESLVGTLRETFAVAHEHGQFPRLRFGLVADGPIVRSSADVADSRRA